MQRSAQYSTWLEIDLSAIESNVRLVRQRSGTAVMAVVKADGYGRCRLRALPCAAVPPGAP